MPALRMPTFQIPELRLPEMSREDIARVIGDARADVDLPKVDLSSVDIPKAISAAAEAAGISRPSRRSRLPFVIGGLVTLGLVGFALMTSPMVRPRLTTLGQKVKERIDELRASDGPEEAHAFDAAVTVPVQPSAFADDAPAKGSPFDGPSELPDGLGAETMPAEELLRR